MCIKFCVRLGKSDVETHEMLRIAFRDKALSYPKTCDVFAKFKEKMHCDHHSFYPLISHDGNSFTCSDGGISDDGEKTGLRDQAEIGISVRPQKLLTGTEMVRSRVEFGSWPAVYKRRKNNGAASHLPVTPQNSDGSSIDTVSTCEESRF